MNAWVLSVIICSATPMTDNGYCSTIPLDFGLTREACSAGIERWRQHPSRPRLECTEDPELTAMLEEGEDDGREIEEFEPDSDSISL